jgi:hypothetical protein
MENHASMHNFLFHENPRRGQGIPDLFRANKGARAYKKTCTTAEEAVALISRAFNGTPVSTTVRLYGSGDL